jgi:RNA-directed DNA polymerase
MSDKRQKNQLQMVLAFTVEGRSEAPKARRERTESLTANCETQSPAGTEQLMEEVCDRENLKRALRRVKTNKGSPGIDGMKVGELSDYLKQHWPAIREQLLSGTYRPQAVKRVEIAKPDGGVRKLGIPTVEDRLLQRAVARILEAVFEADFLECSYGFRPGCNPHGALRALRGIIVTKKVGHLSRPTSGATLTTSSMNGCRRWWLIGLQIRSSSA